MSASDAVKNIYNASLINALSRRRSRRFRLGGELLHGYTKYRSQHEPVPLTKEELALLCWAGAGPTGLALSDIDSGMGCNTQVQHMGRTFPSPCNNHKTTLMFSNDDGVFVYHPREATKPVHIESEEDLENVIDEFDKDIIQLQDSRLELPETAFLRLNVLSSHKPGQTIFMPIVTPTYEMINGFLYMIQYDKYKVIDEDTNQIAGIDKWVDKLGLVNEAPLSFMMNLSGISISLEAGFITQNILLMAEAMGLGAFPHGSGIPMLVMGGTPLIRGLGFRFTTDKKGMPNPVGIDGVAPLEGYCPPYYETMADAVQAVHESKITEEAMFSVTGTPSPLKDQEAFAKGVEPGSEEVLECVKDLCTYIYDKYGRFPPHLDTMNMLIWIGVHHADLNFYDKFYKDGTVSPSVRNHMNLWHKKPSSRT